MNGNQQGLLNAPGEGLLNTPGQRANPYQGYFNYPPMQNPHLQPPMSPQMPQEGGLMGTQNKYLELYKMGYNMGLKGQDLKKWLNSLFASKGQGQPQGMQYEPLTQGSYSGAGYSGGGLLGPTNPTAPVLY